MHVVSTGHSKTLTFASCKTLHTKPCSAAKLEYGVEVCFSFFQSLTKKCLCNCGVILVITNFSVVCSGHFSHNYIILTTHALSHRLPCKALKSLKLSCHSTSDRSATERLPMCTVCAHMYFCVHE